jgi:hypothetical protein
VRRLVRAGQGIHRVTGIDFSARFIRVALQLKEKASHFELVEEGEIVSYRGRLSELG